MSEGLLVSMSPASRLVSAMYAESSDTEWSAVENVLVRCGYLWRCRCGCTYTKDDTQCDACQEGHYAGLEEPSPDEAEHPDHRTRFSFDASSYDEICVLCGARDGALGGPGALVLPCTGSEEARARFDANARAVREQE